MTRAQECMIRKFRRDAETCFNWMEVKQFDVEENEYFVSVYAVIGSPTDEGTLAAVYCRERVHVFIGKRGGMTIPVSKKRKDGTYKHYTKKYSTFLSASIDQR